MAPGCGPGCGTWAMRTGCPAATSTCAVSTSHLPASSGAGVCATCGLMQCPPFSPQCRLLRSSRVPEAPRSQSCLPPHRASRPPTPGPALSSPGPVHLVVLGPAPRGSEASATVFLAPLILPPAPARPRPGVRAQHPLAGLGTILGALQRRVRRPQRRQEQHQVQPPPEQLAQQLCKESLPAGRTRTCSACSMWPPGPRGICIFL